MTEPDAAPYVSSDAEIETGVGLSGFMFTTENLMDITVWRPTDDIECPDSPDECVCPTPAEPWQMREILPAGNMICARREFEVPGAGSDVYLPIDP
jgi:hypothetical protein